MTVRPVNHHSFNNLNDKATCSILLILLLGGLAGSLPAQIGLQVPSPQSIIARLDTNVFSFPKPILPLRDWEHSASRLIEFEHRTDISNIMEYISTTNLPDNPFNLDTRSSSLYVPRNVRDELNLIMNRPRDGAFLPILPIAFLAMQMAGKYLLIQDKTRINWLDIKRSEQALPVLEQLWQRSPQTASQLYLAADIQNRYTMQTLKQMINLLIDNKLVKQKVIENAEIKYFPALNKKSYQMIILRAKANRQDRPLKKNIEINDRTSPVNEK